MSNRRHFLGPLQKAGGMTGETTNDPDQIFVQLAHDRQFRAALDMLDQVRDVNVKGGSKDATALHYAAACRAKWFITALEEQRPDLDWHATDMDGRRASEVAWHVVMAEELGAWLMQKEKAYAERFNKPAWPEAEP